MFRLCLKSAWKLFEEFLEDGLRDNPNGVCRMFGVMALFVVAATLDFNFNSEPKFSSNDSQSKI